MSDDEAKVPQIKKTRDPAGFGEQAIGLVFFQQLGSYLSTLSEQLPAVLQGPALPGVIQTAVLVLGAWGLSIGRNRFGAPFAAAMGVKPMKGAAVSMLFLMVFAVGGCSTLQSFGCKLHLLGDSVCQDASDTTPADESGPPE